MTMTAIPVIDLAPAFDGTPAERRAVADRIDRACREIGFLLISGHGVEAEIVAQTYAMASAFFDLPVEQKLRIRQPAPHISRGDTPFQGESLAASLGDAAPAAELAPHVRHHSPPFFHQPNDDAVIRTLPSCHGPGHPPRYRPFTYGEHWMCKWMATKTG
jgi:isopenicillin N synthase-like dioxygenase